jgi:hypothetical protein
MTVSRITNIAATPAPTEVDDSDFQSTHASQTEDLILWGVKQLRAAGLACPLPEYGMSEGQTQKCDVTGNTSQTCIVSAKLSQNRAEGKVATIQGNKFLVQDSVAHAASVLHAVAGLCGMVAKGKPNMRNFSRRNKVFAQALEILKVESDASQDFKGARGGVCTFSLNNDTLKAVHHMIKGMDKVDVNGGQEVEAKKANTPSTTLYLKADAADGVAFRAMLGLEPEATNSELSAALLERLRDEAGIESALVAVA